MKKHIHVDEYTRSKHGKATHGGLVSEHDKGVDVVDVQPIIKKARYKYRSRATRADEVATNMEMAAGEIRDIMDDEELTKQQKIDDANGILQDLDYGELEGLRDEMSNWRDNMQGTNLENTSRYEAVEEAANALEDIDPSALEINDIDDALGVADELEDMASQLRDIMFPGMYG